MIRKNLKLTKNPFGYSKFPLGCRALLIGDKFYITGGRTETQEFSNVIIYDRKTDSLKRIMDLNYPRSYHTFIFNDVFETIMVIGGEYCNTVEIFDPLTNRWQLLPSLNVPRCNPLFFFDEPRGNMYVLFGIEGNYNLPQPFAGTKRTDDTRRREARAAKQSDVQSKPPFADAAPSEHGKINPSQQTSQKRAQTLHALASPLCVIAQLVLADVSHSKVSAGRMRQHEAAGAGMWPHGAGFGE